MPSFTPNFSVQNQSPLNTNFLIGKTAMPTGDSTIIEKHNDNNSVLVVPSFYVDNINKDNDSESLLPSIPIIKANCNCKNSGCLKLYCDCFRN